MGEKTYRNLFAAKTEAPDLVLKCGSCKYIFFLLEGQFMVRPSPAPGLTRWSCMGAGF